MNLIWFLAEKNRSGLRRDDASQGILVFQIQSILGMEMREALKGLRVTFHAKPCKVALLFPHLEPIGLQS